MLEKLSKTKNKDIFGLSLNKRIEDGLINNLHNASEEQLKRMKYFITFF